MYREYFAQGMYGYVTVHEYHHEHEPEVKRHPASNGGSLHGSVISAITPQKLGREVAAALQAAYDAGQADALRIFVEDPAWVRRTGS